MIRHVLRPALPVALAFAVPAFAAPVFHPSGANLTYGGASNADSVFAATANPAGTARAVDEDATFRMGLLPNVGVGYEIGPVDGFAEEVEDLIDLLDTEFTTVNEAQDAADRANAILPEIGEHGYAKVHASGHVPLFPLMVRTEGWLRGVWSFDINLAGEGWAGVLDAPVTVDTVNQEAESATAAYVKGAEVTEFAIGYSRPLLALGPGELSVGGRMKYVRMALSKQVVALESVEDDDMGEIMQDAYEANQEQSSGVTIDTGVVWDMDWAHVGLAVNNLIEPEFEYGPIGVNCSDIADTVEQNNCYTALHFSDRIDRSETHVLERQATASTGLSLFDGRVTVAGAYDLNAVNDPVGMKYQWASVAAGVQPDSWWIPGVRIGYRKNTAGSRLDMVTAGATFFRVLRLDAAYGLDSVSYDGETFPRTAAVNLGLEAQF